MKRNLNILLIGFCLLFISKDVLAQFFPVQSTFYLKPPYPVYLGDYANPLGDQLSLKVLLRDLNLGATQVYFKFSIKDLSVSYSNNSSPIGKPIFTLVPGAVQTFTQAELSEYFSANSLGISPFAYANVLQEGIYNFSVQVIDVLTNKPLSKIEQSPPLWLVVNDPPILNLPENLSIVKFINPQNILFQWSPRHRQANSVEYEFTLTELIVPDNFRGNLQNMFLSQPAFYQTITRSTSLLYSPALPPLTVGRTYGFRVRAIAKQGLNEVGIFRNNGYTEIFTFRYGERNVAPVILNANWTNGGLIGLNWLGSSVHKSFLIMYEVGTKSVQKVWQPARREKYLVGKSFLGFNQYAYRNYPASFSNEETVIWNNNYKLYDEKENQLLLQTNKSDALSLSFEKVYRFKIGGRSFNPGEPILYSAPFEITKVFNPSNLSIRGIFEDNNEYLGSVNGKVKKTNPDSQLPTCENPEVNPINKVSNGIAKGDILLAGGNKVMVIDELHATSELLIAGSSTAVNIKLFYSSDFAINEYNELIIGFLSTESTGHKIKLWTASTNASNDSNISEFIKTESTELDSIKLLGNGQLAKTMGLAVKLERNKTLIQETKLTLNDWMNLVKTKDELIKNTITKIGEFIQKNKDQQSEINELLKRFKEFEKENLNNYQAVQSFLNFYSNTPNEEFVILLNLLLGNQLL